MKSISRSLGIGFACAVAAGCSGGGSGSSGSSGPAPLGNTPVLDYLLPYASADATGNISQLALLNSNGFSTPEYIAISTQAALAKLNYLGTFDAQTELVQHTRPNLYYYASNGNLFGVNLRVQPGAAQAQQLGNMSNLTAAAVCSINSASDNVATGHVRIYYSLADSSGLCTGSDLTSYYIGNTAPTQIPASGNILSITQFRSPSTSIASGAVVLEEDGEVAYVDGNYQNAKVLQAAGALAPVVLDSNDFFVVLAGPIPGTSSNGIYSVGNTGTVTPLLSAPAGDPYYFSAVSAPNHTLYAAFGPTAVSAGGYLATNASVIYQIDETATAAPGQVYSSTNPISAFRAFPSGVVTLEGVPETDTPTAIDQVVYYSAFAGSGPTQIITAPVVIDDAGNSAVVTFSFTNGNLLLYDVRQKILPSGTASQLGVTAKIASVATSPAQVVSTQAQGTSWFGLGEIVNRDLTSNSQGGQEFVAQVYNLQQRDGSDAGKDSFFAFSVANLGQGNYTGTALGSVDYGSGVINVAARSLTAREDTALGAVAVTYTKGAAALNDVISLDDFNNVATQITNTPSVNEIVY